MGVRDRLREAARAALNELQDRAVAFDAAGGVSGAADRIGARLRAEEERLLAGTHPFDPEHQQRVRLWYARLELAPGANADEVRRAFRQLMRSYHPDRFAGSPDEEELATRLSQELTVAYEGLLAHLGQR